MGSVSAGEQVLACGSEYTLDCVLGALIITVDLEQPGDKGSSVMGQGENVWG